MKKAIFLLLMISIFNVYSQEYTEISNLKTGDYEDQTATIVGLWEVLLVTVGEEKLTPTARWFKFLADGSQTSGNGWVQNGKGSWQYDVAAQQLLTADESGKADEYGAFSADFSDGIMTWERIEDGMKVKVSLKRVEQKPLAPWDKIVGRWQLDRAESHDAAKGETSNPEVESYSYFFRWDRRYRKFNSAGERVETGIWHIEAHDPWLWMIPDNGTEKVGQNIGFDGAEMTFSQKRGQVTEKLFFKKGPQ